MTTRLSETTPIARKRYRCEWCGEFILEGEKHKKLTQIFEGDFQSYRIHLECEHMMEYLCQENPEIFEDGFTPHQHRRGKKYEERVAARLMGEEEWRY